MPGIYTSQHTGSEVDETVQSRPEVISKDELEALAARNTDQNKIYIVSNDNSLYRSDGTAFVRLSNIPYTETAPGADNNDGLKLAFVSSEPANYYSGWIYIIGNPVEHIYAIVNGTNITIK